MRRMILAAVALIASAGGAGAAKHGIDSGLYTTYEWGDTLVRFTVCGQLPQSDGCYGGSQVTSLEKACAVVEGKSHQINNVVTRNVYIMDKRSSATDPVLIYAYRRIDTISDTFDDIKFKFLKKVELPITGGTKSHCALAANDKTVFAGTDAASSAASMSKGDYSTRKECDFPAPVLGITADDRGYITIRVQGAFCVFNERGEIISDGGGQEDMVGNSAGWVFN